MWTGRRWVDLPLVVQAAPAWFTRGFKLLDYDWWMAWGCEWVRKEPSTYHLQRFDDNLMVANFQLGGHWLNVQRDQMRGVAFLIEANPTAGGC